MRFTLAFLVTFLAYVGSVWAENSVTPGELIVEPPTLICLGFEWPFTGDDNRNAEVEVRFREAG